MTEFKAGSFDVAVVGAGHAGCEAALAAARMGFSVGIFAVNMDHVAMMACNPSIGGTSKGHLVREIDALGGEMGRAIDDTFLQIRMLNTSKGPAVHSLRAQADKHRYQIRMKQALESAPNLYCIQGEVCEIRTEGGRVSGVLVSTGELYECRACVVASGVYLKSRIIIGEFVKESGPSGLAAATLLSTSLKELGFSLRRFKTGTPARVDGRSLDYTKMSVQEGDSEIIPFSFLNDRLFGKQVPCYITYTNEQAHDIIRANIHRSPLYSGIIEGIGPRYCPSIEDKVMRFPERDRHQIFIEPESADTCEMYVQGMSSSLPVDVQMAVYRCVPGMEQVRFTRPAYAIEYDCIDSTALRQTLESKDIPGLFFAGQICGSSGYEEAAGQGILAGINAGQYLKGEEPLLIDRRTGYIGVLVDDLVTKGTNEPYRMMTSRAEYRLLLRQDNADLRLTDEGRRVGLVTDSRYDMFMRKRENVAREIERLKGLNLSPSEAVNEYLAAKGEQRLETGAAATSLIRRPGISYADILALERLCGSESEEKHLLRQEREEIEVALKYEGYIEKEERAAETFSKAERKLLPDDLDYLAMEGISTEARQKLAKLRPASLGQASRISGVSPADISVLMIYLERLAIIRKEKSENV